ncbi:GNAT superfamily N-acetyltransferase [Methylobacterium sp. BE186]|uniref:GNAT family N-acetyltransferase n=1 Tax=Methylobacterium sp. BE186 TaxID=2817715 RepID=UPI002864F4D5|nr:GNAT family N-acetyltransferase [Methylobacterium sp. BE186]MDR7038550.1 GNAT superfamily N-acetyltransferase [Methylobacterium sp. BE186]
MGNRYGLEIRTATAADAAGLAELMGAAGHPVPVHALAERLDAMRYGHGTALLALEWGPPSGIVALHWYPDLKQASPVAQVTMLLVGPEERRRGIGRQLLKAASQAARMAGCATLQLLAEADQPDLRAFCAATGFSEGAGCLVRPLRKKG